VKSTRQAITTPVAIYPAETTLPSGEMGFSMPPDYLKALQRIHSGIPPRGRYFLSKETLASVGASSTIEKTTNSTAITTFTG